jgi:hypothetical protein
LSFGLGCGDRFVCWLERLVVLVESTVSPSTADLSSPKESRPSFSSLRDQPLFCPDFTSFANYQKIKNGFLIILSYFLEYLFSFWH